MSDTETTGKDVARPTIAPAQLKEIATFDDALRLIQETYGDAALETAAQALGDGFALTDNKDRFIGVPLVLVHWTISLGDYPNPKTGEVGNFVAARLVTKDGGKYIITDGGTGIARQLEDYTAETGKTFLVAQKGLRVSTYENEYTKEGKTYYVDTSASE